MGIEIKEFLGFVHPAWGRHDPARWSGTLVVKAEKDECDDLPAIVRVEVSQEPRKWSGERRIHSAPNMDEVSDKRWILLPSALRDLPERSTVKVTIETTD